MSKCLWCKGPVETNSRNGKPLKYCSKKCSNEFYKKRNKNELKEKLDPPTPCKACGTLVERFLSNKPRKYCSEKCAKDPQWMKRLKKNAWIEENCFSKEEVAKKIGISTHTVTNRMKKLNLKEHWKIVNGLNYVFVRKIDVDPIKNINADKKIPDGFVNRKEAAKILGVKITTVAKKIYKLKKKLGYPPVEIRYVQLLGKDNKSVHSAPVYKIQDLLKIKNKYHQREFNCLHCGKLTQTIYPDKMYCSKACTNNAKKKRMRDRFSADNISSVECYELFPKLGIVGKWPSPKTYLQKNIKKFGFTKKYGTYYIPETQFDSFIKRFRKAYSLEKQIRELEKQDIKLRRHKKIIRRTVEQNEWEYQERLLFFRLNEKILRCKEKWGINSPQFQELIIVQTKRFSYLTDYWATGNIKKFTCSSCSQEKAFHEFHTSTKSSFGKGVDTQACKLCISERGKEKRKAQSLVERKKYRQKNYRGRLRTLVANSIKQKIHKKLKRYENGLGVRPVWRAIEKQCGYNIDELVAHIEKQFTPNMNWQNQTKPKKPGEYGWELDHIIPHSSFNYDSLSHPDFAKCWALKNLRPLSGIMNSQKGNKDLYKEHYRTYRDGLRSDKEYTRGVWRFLPYTNLDAKKYIEKKFDVGMTWENHGKVWHLDHIDPLAHLAYLCESDENFIKAWSLTNLQPLTQHDNCSKSSIFEEELWYHNYIDTDQNSQDVSLP